MAKQSRCEDCMNYVYDEEYDCYTCEQGAELDEDEMAQFLIRAIASRSLIRAASRSSAAACLHVGT